MSNDFGKRVREARGSLTQQEFADILGVTMQYIQVVEYGKSLLSMDKLILLCEATGRPPSFFLQDYLEISKSGINTELRNDMNQFDSEQLDLLSIMLEAIKKNNNAKD